MPWLEKDQHENNNGDITNNLLFIHVPRCGGTSLMKSHNVPYKATQHSSYCHKLGMQIFFHRYKLLESANFPLWTWGNAVCVLMVATNTYARFVYLPKHTTDTPPNTDNTDPAVLLKAVTSFAIVFFLSLFLGLTYVFVAPTIGRILYVRRLFLLLVEYGLMGAMESLDYLTGTNIHGYLPHLTAHKMLHYGYVAPQEMEHVASLAIVRNPYSRMVSIYMYNRFGAKETFKSFLYSWYKNMHYYRESGEMEEWYTPCHVIPQFEYTHFEGSQLVQSIVKQEELKYLKHKQDLDVHANEIEDTTVQHLPQTVKDALLGMPHANKRNTSKPWYEYYDQDTLNLTYEMYQIDFEIFEYPKSIKERPDLSPPLVSESLAQSVSRSMANGTYTPPPTITSSRKQEPKQSEEKCRHESIELFDLSTPANTTSTAAPVTTTNTKEGGGGGALLSPPPPAILFESFSRDTSNEDVSTKQQRRRRSSLLLKSANVSARHSSMLMSVRNSTTQTSGSTRSIFNDSFTRSLLATELTKLVDDDDEDNTVTDHDDVNDGDDDHTTENHNRNTNKKID